MLEIERRRPLWEARGIAVSAVTWRDLGARWPYPLKTDRAMVGRADSIGVRLQKGAQEGSVVLFDGGWADLMFWAGTATDEILDGVPGWDDWLTVERFGSVLDRLASQFE